MVEQVRDLTAADMAGEAAAADTPGQAKTPCWRYAHGEWTRIEVLAAEEFPLQIFVNGSELVTTLCTPVKVNCLVAGFLYNEGIINSLREIASMRVCLEDFVADVRLATANFTPPTRRMLTSGCGGGASFIEERVNLKPVQTEARFAPEKVLGLMRQLYQKAQIHQSGGGVHASALCDAENVLVLSEDVGRHNTLDKISGECLLTNAPMTDRLLITTGRISSEMLLKAARMEVPVVVSRGAALTRTIAVGEKLGVTVIGYARADHLEVYSHPERIINHRLNMSPMGKEKTHAL